MYFCLLCTIPSVVFGNQLNGFYFTPSVSFFKLNINQNIRYRDIVNVNNTHQYDGPILNYKIGFNRSKNNFGICFNHNLTNREKTIILTRDTDTLQDEKWFTVLGVFLEYNRELLNYNEIALVFAGFDIGYSGYQFHYNAYDFNRSGNCSLYNHYSIFGDINAKILIGYKKIYFCTGYSISIGKREQIKSSYYGIDSDANNINSFLILPRINIGLELRI